MKPTQPTPMHPGTVDPMLDFRAFCRQVEALLEREYALTLADAGLELADLAGAFADGERPGEFVGWFALKCELTHRSDWSLEHASRLLYKINGKGDTA